MRKTVLIFLLALCFCLTGACSGVTTQSAPTAAPVAEAEPTEAPADDSGTDLYIPGEAGYVDDSGTDIPAPESLFTDLAAEDCIEDAWPEAGVMPRITLDCPGAESINEKIAEKFTPVADDPMSEGLSYTCYKGAGRVLSIVMEEHWPNDCSFFTCYNLDLATGQELSGRELLALLAVDEASLSDLEQAVMGQEFTRQFGAAEDQADADFYSQQYEKTTSPENVDLDRVWLGDDGQLCFVGRIYPLAGAESYEYPLGSTLYFN